MKDGTSQPEAIREDTALIRCSDVTFGYGGPPVLRDISFAISPGEIVTIVGPNGSGKTSFLKGLIGALKPLTGRITQRSGLRLGYVPQRLHVDASLPMTVARFLNLPRRQARTRVTDALERAGAVGLGTRQITALSGGQMQRVLLARALLDAPDLLLLDEPTQSLDQPGAAAFYRQIEEVRADLGCAVLMVSHDLHVVMSASDRVICLNGHICCEGQPEMVAAAPEYRALFGEGTHGTLALYRHHHDHDHNRGPNA
ncbi:MAG: metal ABC transporter ATP-binding protein [Pseudomonadota bacterium]